MQNRNAEGVHDIRIDLHVVLPARETLPESADSHCGDWVADGRFVRLAEARRFPIESCIAFALVTVATYKVLRARAFGQIAKARNINPTGPGRASEAVRARQIGEFPGRSAANPYVIHQIMPQHTAGIPEPIRILRVG